MCLHPVRADRDPNPKAHRQRAAGQGQGGGGTSLFSRRTMTTTPTPTASLQQAEGEGEVETILSTLRATQLTSLFLTFVTFPPMLTLPKLDISNNPFAPV